MLLECLIGISIFSFGILAISALQANAMRHSASSSSRTTATQLIQRLDGEMRSNVSNLDNFAMARTECKNAAPTSDNAKDWASAVDKNLNNAICSVVVQKNIPTTSTPCSRQVTISINWPTQRGAKTGVATGKNQGMNEATTVIDIPTILETRDPQDTEHLRCGL
jgi:Tfp pilus assembly protein PilV